MIKRKADKFWFPWWPEKWLWGTIRIECTPAERGIWVDLLSLASKDDGHIRANEETPYPLRQLAGTLLIPEKELGDAISKFLKLEKLTKTKTGTLYVTKWDKYQFSDRHKRRIETGDVPKSGHSVSKKVALKNSILEYNKVKYNKVELKSHITDKQSTEIVGELITVKGISLKKAGSLVYYLKELSIEFPDVDYVEEMKKKCSWWRDHPLTNKSNIHLQIRNWFSLAKKFQKEDNKEKKVGESIRVPSKEEEDYSKARAIKMKQIMEIYQPEIDKAMKAKSSEWMDEIDNKIKEEIAKFSRKYREEKNGVT